jgi:hypothetical protein
VYCDGSSSVIIAARSCSVPMSVFWTATYLVNVGQPIIAQVEALNGIGYSIPSVDNSFAALAIIVPQASPTLSRGSLTTEAQV